MEWPGDGTLIATCSGGAEDALAAELAAAGFAVTHASNGAIRFRGRAAETVRANREIRTASRVLVPVAQGPVRRWEELYRLASRPPWSRLIPPQLTIAVTAVSTDRALADTRLAALKVKDAVVDIQRRSGARSSVDRRNPDAGLAVFIADGTATISLDSSGAPLHVRGYRTEAGEAPLRETVAAAMLAYAGWPRPGTLLLDPFCGAGTIAIEAALAAAGVTPGDLRDHSLRSPYGFERWPWLRTPQLPVRSSVTPGGEPGAALPPDGPRRATEPAPEAPLVIARDTDSRVLEIARRNARRAGVETFIRFEQADAMSALPPGETTGLIVTNPPYGERMDLEHARRFYRDLGDSLKRSYAGWRAFILSANRDGMKGLGLRPSSRRQLWNGGLDARLYEVVLHAR